MRLFKLLVKQKFQQRFLTSTTASYSSYFGKWQLPEGELTGIKVYNSAVNKKVPLILKKKGVATWYVCGPTVYDESHIGHASCYVKFDVIRRIMENVFNINVLMLMGITDIDDKIIKKSLEVGLKACEISKKYEIDFFEDMAKMRVNTPTSVSRVTENIHQIILFCKKLIEKEYAYVTDEGSVYFIVSKGASAYLLNEIPEETQVTIDPLKRDKRDFALWKASCENEPHWLSPWGIGRPGWHIECSVMASNVFGSHLDIHSGGYDLLFPHHCNEKSQSEAYHGCSQWVNYWLHSGLLQAEDDVKMSKSIKNTISVKEFLKHNCANDFRILCLQSPYRKNMSYSIETLTGAKGLHKKFHYFINESEKYISKEVNVTCLDEDKLLMKLKHAQEKVISLFADDFNTAQALLILINLIDEMNASIQPTSSKKGTAVICAYSDYIDQTLQMLGVNILCKKKLKKSFVLFIDAINKYRNCIRLLALNQNYKGGTFIASEYIDQAYASCNESIQMVIDSEDLLSDMQDILNALNSLHKKSSEFVSTIIESSSNTPDLNKKKISQLLIFCDELRTSLEKYGIAIKDEKQSSIWFPLTSLQNVAPKVIF